MPEYQVSDINYIIRKEDFEKIYKKAKNLREKNLVFILYITGARPSEILSIKKEDIEIKQDRIIFYIVTKKIKKKKTGKTFMIDKRHLEIPIKSDSIYSQNLLKYLRVFKEDDRIFKIDRKTIYNIVSRLSKEALGICLCPYNFRHSLYTRLVEMGKRLEDVQYIKGAKDIRSVIPYWHAKKREYEVEI